MNENRKDIPIYFKDGFPVYDHGNYSRGEPPEVDIEAKERLTKSLHSKRSFKHSSRSSVNRNRSRKF